jgi:hypothetical protein
LTDLTYKTDMTFRPFSSFQNPLLYNVFPEA